MSPRKSRPDPTAVHLYCRVPHALAGALTHTAARAGIPRSQLIADTLTGAALTQRLRAFADRWDRRFLIAPADGTPSAAIRNPQSVLHLHDPVFLARIEHRPAAIPECSGRVFMSPTGYVLYDIVFLAPAGGPSAGTTLLEAIDALWQILEPS